VRGAKETTNMQQRRAITKNEGVMLGKPTVAGTRLTVELILEKLAAGEGVGKIVESYPRLDREAIHEALLFAARRVEEVLSGLAEEPLVDAVTALDDNSAGDERIEAPPRRHFPDEAEPPTLLAVTEKVLQQTCPKNELSRPCGSSRARTSHASSRPSPWRRAPWRPASSGVVLHRVPGRSRWWPSPSPARYSGSSTSASPDK
jgi:uncharacterized protein (DUF433 family)